MINDVPQYFDESFLSWFQKRTEEAWRHYRTRTLEEFVASGVGGYDWQQGTRWSGGLSEQEIIEIEQRWQLPFPPDYRLFLQRLHSVDRSRVGARYGDGSNMISVTKPSFYHWQDEILVLQEAWEWLVEGLCCDVQQNNLWLRSWGAKPTTREAQETRIRELVNAAPKLIPLFGHCYLLAEPCEVGNPVLSIYQSDIIIYGVDLRHYFLIECGNLLGIKGSDMQEIKMIYNKVMNNQWELYQKIPFWGEFL